MSPYIKAAIATTVILAVLGWFLWAALNAPLLAAYATAALGVFLVVGVVYLLSLAVFL